MLGMKFGEFIEHHRKKAKLSAGQLARLLELSSVYVRHVETGKAPPFIDEQNRYAKLAVLLSVDREELLVRATVERGEFTVVTKGWDETRIKALCEAVSILEPSEGRGSSIVFHKLLSLLRVPVPSEGA